LTRYVSYLFTYLLTLCTSTYSDEINKCIAGGNTKTDTQKWHIQRISSCCDPWTFHPQDPTSSLW